MHFVRKKKRAYLELWVRKLLIIIREISTIREKLWPGVAMYGVAHL